MICVTIYERKHCKLLQDEAEVAFANQSGLLTGSAYKDAAGLLSLPTVAADAILESEMQSDAHGTEMVLVPSPGVPVVAAAQVPDPFDMLFESPPLTDDEL